jgi:hypothetical protein
MNAGDFKTVTGEPQSHSIAASLLYFLGLLIVMLDWTSSHSNSNSFSGTRIEIRVTQFEKLLIC